MARPRSGGAPGALRREGDARHRRRRRVPRRRGCHARGGGAAGYEARYLARGRALAPPALVDWWREAAHELVFAARTVDAKARLPWYGPDMSALSFMTARLMETWSHGLDVVDVVGLPRPDTDRLRHVVFLGVMTRALLVRQSRPARRRSAGLRRADGAVGSDLDSWRGDGRQPDRGQRQRLLPRGDAAPARGRHGPPRHRAFGGGMDAPGTGLCRTARSGPAAGAVSRRGAADERRTRSPGGLARRRRRSRWTRRTTGTRCPAS